MFSGDRIKILEEGFGFILFLGRFLSM
ncbi:hypothetical protein KUCAC02_004568 [Chaenocephalus aceratus]|uniref:Uncharacterized protein n=1 Tax=Chaenocephalus aceratus TaxID=36190 RepID=A0ACB9X0U8_CHAAC|nr:hypothetical protein KUCAC02_004568 [Chaenocephalus aceratus]